ncbi:hypothetical protein [Paracoccus liaowanqingii]|uniref:hypothetical protein n=1 Tax=Paracoccus liaowanqingii TaxID=2560053 RepID=UPI00159BA7D3|nr:hypothetical protein [Paracoccus liaowanqingii]
MATFAADLRALVDLAKEDLRYVAMMSIQDVLEGAQTTQRGITQGAEAFEVGKIPVGLTSDLVNSLTVEGSTGPDAYVTAIVGMAHGDVMTFEWTVPYAARIEFGFTGTDELGRNYDVPGRFFIGTNAAKFPQFVEARAAEVRK